MRYQFGLLERHVEKAILALVGVALLGMIWTYLCNTPHKVVYDGREVTAAQLFAAISADAEALEQCMKNARVQSERVPDYGVVLARLHGAGLLAETRNKRFDTLELPLAVPFGRPLDLSDIRPDPVRLVTPPAPSDLTVSTGRAILAGGKVDSAASGSGAVAEREIGWVRVAARFDREELRRELLAAGYPPYAAQVCLASVQAQRQEQLEDGRYSEWEDVNSAGSKQLAAIPKPLFDEQKEHLLNRDGFDAVYAELKASVEEILHPDLGQILAGDAPLATLEEDANSESWTLWLDDCSAESGRYYRYRLRVWMWKPVRRPGLDVGRRG